MLNDVSTITSEMQYIKDRLLTWTPEKDGDQIMGSAETAELLGISYKKVGILTKQGILKNRGYDKHEAIFNRSELLQVLRDNSVWKQPKPAQKNLEHSKISKAIPLHTGIKKVNKNAVKGSRSFDKNEDSRQIIIN